MTGSLQQVNQSRRVYYNLLINVRVENKRTSLGKMYLENTYTNKTIIAKANNTWLIK